MDIKHYNQEPKRDAEFIKPPNMIKAKVGAGGLDESVLDRAQKVLENHAADFKPIGDGYLRNMMLGIEKASEAVKSGEVRDAEAIIAGILYPCAQLKANGGMFHFPLVTRIADRLVQFLEVVEGVDQDVVDISMAFHKTLSLVIDRKIKDAQGEYAEKLADELNAACMRYFDKQKS